MSHDYPFEGLRVVDASQGIAGPSAGMMLARYGANVIKVEPRAGDWSRGITAGKDGMTAMALATNVGKRSIALVLKQREGSDLLHRLAKRADVFIATAVKAGLSLLVSGDKDLLEAPLPPGLQVLTPAQALSAHT